MEKRIKILAATKRKDNGVCIAGIDQKGSWVRPVKAGGGYFATEELLQDKKVIIDTFYEVDFKFDGSLAEPPNTEDYKVSDDFKPRFVRQITDNSERISLLNSCAETDVKSIFNEGNRSLGLVKCAELIDINMGWGKDDKFYSHISFKDSAGADYTLSTTDLRWAAYGKNIMKQNRLKALRYNDADLKNRVKQDNLFFSLGLTKEPDCGMKELIIGVFTIPDYANQMNFLDLQSTATNI